MCVSAREFTNAIILGNGYESRIVTALRFLWSTENLKVPSFFGALNLVRPTKFAQDLSRSLLVCFQLWTP